jgi:dTDP-4-amino-4,6-dideoxygalactose transaminase
VNSRLDTVQAAVLLAKLDVFAEEIALRNVLAGRYEAALADIVVTPGKSAGITSAWAQYTIRTPHRDQLQVGLKERGVPTAIYYPKPMSDQPAYSAYADTAYPVSEQLCSEVLSLPMNPYHDDEQVERVVTAVREVLAEPTTSRVAA